jgi:outer membrane receptor for ferrienterochelin and colicins
MKFKILISLLLVLCCSLSHSQNISGYIQDSEGVALPFANILVENTEIGTTSDKDGYFQINFEIQNKANLKVSFIGFLNKVISLNPQENNSSLNIRLEEIPSTMDEIVVSGTLKPISKLESPVPVEVYSPTFFKKNPTANVFEALQNVNGVRPQLNCQVCNTGDIHINGLEGPYTMVLIDGMPIVSSLATVYGLSGIPNSLIDRMEVVKGPASSLYGSEAIGGLINIITKNPLTAPKLSLDIMASSWEEYNVDLGYNAQVGKSLAVLTGINYFNFQNVVDNNDDNFTDMTLQERFSLFQKYVFKRPEGRLFTLAGRYYRENRWGGELDWTPQYKGGDEIYGETIDTERWEILGQYQLPFKERLVFSFSANGHDQDSAYGDLLYIADQKIGFGQLTWDKQIDEHDLLFGTAVRYNYYDDNSPATAIADSNILPGVFIQDVYKIDDKNEVLGGLRYDHHEDHGGIFTPRVAYKHKFSEDRVFRLNAGTGFRVVNLFTEDHAALTGARDVIILEDLEPERSYNVNLNFSERIFLKSGGFVSLDASAWYTYFTNLILPDYDTNPNQIIYRNLNGFAVSKGLSLQMSLAMANGFSSQIGATLMDVSNTQDSQKSRQILTERFSATWALSYRFPRTNLSVDYTGNLYSPMLLPTLGPLDPRPDQSPWWSIQNIQFTYKTGDFEFYTGVKNLLNWTPWKNADYPIIARSFDPFDRDVTFDNEGMAVATDNNPYALTFDPSYVYAPNQGIRAFGGIRYNLFK